MHGACKSKLQTQSASIYEDKGAKMYISCYRFQRSRKRMSSQHLEIHLTYGRQITLRLDHPKGVPRSVMAFGPTLGYLSFLFYGEALPRVACPTSLTCCPPRPRIREIDGLIWLDSNKQPIAASWAPFSFYALLLRLRSDLLSKTCLVYRPWPCVS